MKTQSKGKANLGKRETAKDIKPFDYYLIPEYLQTCSDLIAGQDQTVSLIKLIDQFVAYAFPLQIHKCVFVAQFRRNQDVPIEEFLNAGLAHKFVLVNPKGEQTDLAQFSLAEIDPANPWPLCRSFVDYSSRLILNHQGVYSLKVFGRTHNHDYREVIGKPIPVTLVKGTPGFYSVEFSADRTKLNPEKQGAGHVVLLPDGNILGGDQGYGYTGTYRIENEAIEADLKIRRRNPLATSVFGNVEEFSLILKGKAEDGVFRLEGHRKDDPKYKIWLILNRQTKVPTDQTF